MEGNDNGWTKTKKKKKGKCKGINENETNRETIFC